MRSAQKAAEVSAIAPARLQLSRVLLQCPIFSRSRQEAIEQPAAVVCVGRRRLPTAYTTETNTAVKPLSGRPGRDQLVSRSGEERQSGPSHIRLAAHSPLIRTASERFVLDNKAAGGGRSQRPDRIELPPSCSAAASTTWKRRSGARHATLS
jgi:hypothetical protein